MKYWMAGIAAACALTMVAPQGFAQTIITVRDGIPSTGFLGGPTGPAGEMLEVEQGAQANATWDLENFVLDYNTDPGLAVASRFDMKSGIAGLSGQYVAPMGDIFVRVGSAVDQINHVFDFVIHFPDVPSVEPFSPIPYWSAGVDTVRYEVFAAADVASLINTGANGITGAGAVATGWLWRVEPADVNPLAAGNASYIDDLGGTELQGASRDILYGIELASWLPTADDVNFYVTMGCANDVLRGRINVADGGLTLLLLGISFAGIAAVRRQRG